MADADVGVVSPVVPRWYAIRTRSRHEKKVAAQLAGRGVEPFLPLAKRWSSVEIDAADVAPL